MGVFNEYINKRLKPSELEAELKELIKSYCQITGRHLYIYSAAINKEDSNIALEQEDYYLIHDMLNNLEGVNDIDVYIETPGGSGEAAEEIIRYLHKKFTGEVNFLIAGECKSAGTIIALGGHNIMMTETGSLGPIDAQIFIGRSVMSAHDYMEWVKETKDEAARTHSLNPFDATIVAQITPGEIGGVNNALEFAVDLVKKWLCEYKFANWTETETKKEQVTPERREARANEIAKKLTNHTDWRSHARSIKIQDLEELGLKIDKIDDNPDLAKVVYSIKAVLMLLYMQTAVYKIFADSNSVLKKYAKAPKNPMNENA